MDKIYDPKKVEDKIYQLWEKSGFFEPDSTKSAKENYCIVMPPPNVTGVLHMGHALTLTLEDIMIRQNRMLGKKTLWLPGTDHAAIATQAKVEKMIKDKEGKNRHDLGRKEFLKRVEKFAQDSHDTIVKQTKKLGASCDWLREAYTLDETRHKAVYTVFKMMYDDGLIYRGNRIVNWCPNCQTTLSDDEVEYKETRGKLYYIKYKLSSKDEIVVATTRPETKLGDTGIAVNPSDKRYKKFVGKIYEIDLAGHKIKVKVFAEKEVDKNFGTGAIGITPAHSFVDNQWAKKNKLDEIQVINEKGEMTSAAGKYAGMGVRAAREEFIKDLKNAGLLVKEEDYTNNLSLCYRCDSPTEPLPSRQWFIDVNKKIPRYKKSLKVLAIDAVKKGVFGNKKINIIPKSFEKIYFQWLNNLRDWCISRQIWYGHRIPVWYQLKTKKIYVGTEPPKGKGWIQDEDTLDTWFSSGLWTFSTLARSPKDIGVKNGKVVIKTKDFKDFHPTAVLETGYDILFFWVARMIIMTTYATGDIPFENVYLSGLVLDEKGQKMSKSKGNAIDPMEVAGKYGTDAVRLSLVTGTSPGQDFRMSEEKIKGFRNFSNKLWNIARYCETSGTDFKLLDKIKKTDIKTSADHWIIKRLEEAIDNISRNFQNYQFSLASESLKNFTWSEFADWYLEINKIRPNKKILGFIMDKLLKLWHPFIPFVTEHIYRALRDKKQFLMTAPWPKAEKLSDIKAAQNFEIVKDIIIKIRNVRAIYRIQPFNKLDVDIVPRGVKIKADELEIIENLAKLEKISIGRKLQGKGAVIVGKDYRAFVQLEGIIDIEREKSRLQKELDNLTSYKIGRERKLANESFVKNAPEKIVRAEKEKLEQVSAKIEEIKKHLENLG